MAQTNAASLHITPRNSDVPIASDSYARCAEQVIAGSDGKLRFPHLTTTKIRGIYSLVTNIYTRVGSEEDFEACRADLQYIKVKMAYESGKDRNVKGFIEDSCLMKAIDQVKTYDQFILYCRYAESLVAYFKFYGGKEK